MTSQEKATHDRVGGRKARFFRASDPHRTGWIAAIFRIAASLLIFLALPACDRAKELISTTVKSVSVKPSTSAAPVAGAAVVRDLDAASYDGFVASPDQLMVVDFHADWCGPCKVIGPVLEQVAGEFSGKVKIGKVDVDHAKELAQRAGVSSIPDVRLFRAGKEVDRFVGAVDAAKVRALFQKHSDGVQLAKLDPNSPAAAEPAIQPMKSGWMPPGIERR